MVSKLAALLTVVLLAVGCGLTKDDCEKDGGRWVCVDDAPGPDPTVCVCDEGDDASYGPDPLPW